MMTDAQKQQHEHIMMALNHLAHAGLGEIKLTEALTLLSSVFLGDKQKMLEILEEISEHEKDLINKLSTETPNANNTEDTQSNEVH